LAQNPPWQNPKAATPSVVQVLFGPWGEDIPGDGLEYCGPTATLMAIYYLYDNGFTQLAPAAYGGQEDPNATNLELVLGGLMQTSSVGGTTTGMAEGVCDYLSACGIPPDVVTLTTTTTPNLIWLQTALAPNVAQNPDTIVLANFTVSWFALETGTTSTYSRTGGHFLTPLVVQQMGGMLTLNNPAPSTFIAGARSPSSNPQTVLISSVPAGWTLQGISDPQAYSQVITPKLGPGQATLAVLTNASAWAIPASMSPAGGWQPSPWQLAASKTINTNGGMLTVQASLEGAGGIAKSGQGTLLLTGANSLSGLNNVYNGTLASTQTSGSPFGTGSVALSGGGVLMLCPANSASTSVTIASSAGAVCTIEAGGGTIALAGSGAFDVLLGGNTKGDTGNIARAGRGTLVIAPGGGIAGLGSNQNLQVVGGKGNQPRVSNGMVAPFIVGQDSDSGGSGSFLTYASAGFQPAATVTSDRLGIDKVKSTMVYEVVDSQTLDSKAQVAALEMNGGEIDGTGTLLIGSQATGDVAGLIMNGGSIYADTLAFGQAEGAIYTNNGGSGTAIYSAIAGTAGLTTFGPGGLVLGEDNASSLSGPISVNAGTLIAAADGATGAGDVTVYTGATLQVQAAVPGAVTVEQSGVLYLDGGTIEGSLSISGIGQTSDAPGGILQGYGTVSGTASVGGAIQCGPTVGWITFTGETTISSDLAFYWQLQGPYDNTTQNSGPGIGWNAIAFQSTSTTVGSEAQPVRVFLDFSVIGGDPDQGDSFWNSSLAWTIATFPSGTTPACWVTHGNFTYDSGCFCICVQGSDLNLLWQPGATSQNWCNKTS
jgi:autotransporter-associated beta strand protein